MNQNSIDHGHDECPSEGKKAYLVPVGDGLDKYRELRSREPMARAKNDEDDEKVVDAIQSSVQMEKWSGEKGQF